MAEVSPEEWGARYRAARGTYQSMTARLRALVIDLLAAADVEVIQVEARTKDIDSFTEKIIRKRSKYADPLTDITDIVGLRIITYYVEDVARVGELIRSEFQVDEANSIDKAAWQDPDRFGYASVHYVVSLSPARQKLGEWRSYAKIRAEIQVRTALQHAWAAVNHKLDYKSATEAPPELRRRLFRLSALFELADEQFSGLRDARVRIEAQYATEVQGGQLEIPLDEVSLAAYLQDQRHRSRVERIVTDNGGSIEEPAVRKLARDRKDLLKVLTSIGISTVAQLDEYLTKEIFAVPLEGSPLFRGNDIGVEDALTWIILADQEASQDSFRQFYTPESWGNFLDDVQTWHQAKGTGGSGDTDQASGKAKGRSGY
jgi:ppGpp synthetase/RelA/SpoT-type nucleotidyltranferase